MAGKALFAPRELKDPEYLEKFRGIYIPYWVYDISYDETVKAAGVTTSTGLNSITTNYYDVYCGVDAEYTGVSYDASASFDDHISETIAPFNTANMQEFTPSFLSGFYADTADVDKNLYRADAVKAAQTDAAAQLASFNGLRQYSVSHDAARQALSMRMKRLPIGSGLPNMCSTTPGTRPKPAKVWRRATSWSRAAAD